MNDGINGWERLGITLLFLLLAALVTWVLQQWIKMIKKKRLNPMQLRKKIEQNPAKPILLITESGIGYRFGE